MTKRPLVKQLEGKSLPARPQPLVHDGERILELIGEPGFPGDVDPKSLDKEERRAAVAVLVGAGWTPAPIARRLGVTSVTIHKDIVKIRDMASRDSMGVTIRQVAGHLQLRLDHQYRQTIKVLESTNDPKIKMRAIKLSVEITKAQLEVWQKLGFQTTGTDERQFHQAVSAKVMVKVQQMMVIVEKHVDEGRRPELASGWKEILADIPLRAIDGEVV